MWRGQFEDSILLQGWVIRHKSAGIDPPSQPGIPLGFFNCRCQAGNALTSRWTHPLQPPDPPKIQMRPYVLRHPCPPTRLCTKKMPPCLFSVSELFTLLSRELLSLKRSCNRNFFSPSSIPNFFACPRKAALHTKFSKLQISDNSFPLVIFEPIQPNILHNPIIPCSSIIQIPPFLKITPID